MMTYGNLVENHRRSVPAKTVGGPHQPIWMGESVIRVLLDGASITVAHDDIRVTLDAKEFARIENVWSVARRRVVRHGIGTRTLEQLMLRELCARPHTRQITSLPSCAGEGKLIFSSRTRR